MNPFQKLLMATAVILLGVSAGRQVFSSVLPPVLGFGFADRSYPADLLTTIQGTLGALDQFSITASAMMIQSREGIAASGAVGASPANVGLLSPQLADQLFHEHQMNMGRPGSNHVPFQPTEMNYCGAPKGGRIVQVQVAVDPADPARCLIRVEAGSGQSRWCERLLDEVTAQIPIQAARARLIGPPSPK